MSRGRPRVGHVCWQYGGHHEGISRAVTELCERLSQNCDVYIYASSFSGYERDSLHFRKVKVSGLLGWLWVVGFGIASGRMLAEDRLDLVHLHVPAFAQADFVTCHIFPEVMLKWTNSLEGEARQLLTFRNRLKILAYSALKPFYRYNFAEGRSRHVLAVSKTVKRDLMELYGVRNDRISVVPLGVDTEKFHPRNGRSHRHNIRRQYGISEQTFLFVFIGQNFVGKGLQYVVSALGLVKEERIHLLVVGSGAGTGQIVRSLAHQKGVEHLISFAGEQKDVTPFLSAADTLVASSPYESFGLAILEAMASGLPVIATKAAGFVSEVMEGFQAGILLDDPSDYRELARAMRELSGRREEISSMAAAARNIAESYTWDAHYDQLREVYRRIAGIAV